MAWQQLLPVLGIALLVFMAWQLGALKSAQLQGEEEARARFAADFPDISPKQVFVGTDGRAALLVFDDARLGAVFSVGDRFATRLFQPGDLEKAPSADHDISIETGDITIPYLTIKGVSSVGKDTLSHLWVTNGGAA